MEQARQSVRINGEQYTYETLSLLLGHENAGEKWFQDIYEFLREWLSDSGDIIVNTSGSTGTPQPFALPKDLMRASARATNTFFNLNSQSRSLLMLSATYIAGKMMLVRAIEGDYDILVYPPSKIVDLPSCGEIDLLAIVPYQLQAMLDEMPDYKFDNVKNIIVGGAPILIDLEERVKGIDAAVYSTYGMTETASHVALRRVGLSHFYEALPGVSFSTDDRGCLVIKAENLNIERLVTNDIVSLLEGDNRYFQWMGRFDFVINSAGVKLNPEQIENKLAKAIQDRYYLTKRPDSKLGDKAVLIIESEPYSEHDMIELMRSMQASLDKYEMPKEIHFVDKFAETPTGKVIRK